MLDRWVRARRYRHPTFAGYPVGCAGQCHRVDQIRRIVYSSLEIIVDFA
jgi:hypothetical protein